MSSWCHFPSRPWNTPNDVPRLSSQSYRMRKTPLHPAALLLQRLAERGVAFVETIDRAPGIRVAVRIVGKVADAQIHPQAIMGRERGRFGPIHHGRQTECPIPVDRIRLALDAIHPHPTSGRLAVTD